MKKKKYLKIELIIFLVIFSIISLATIYSTNDMNNDFLLKQLCWYIISFIILFVLKKFNIEKIIDKSFIIYVFLNILLLLLLFFGKEVNGSKCWFVLPGIGSIQISEFMKISLILLNVKIFNEYDKKKKNNTLFNNIKLMSIIYLFTLIPSILTFLEPDTGMVIIYFLISSVMLFYYGIKKRIIGVSFLLIFIFFFIFGYMFLNNKDLFIKLFGTSFFYRIDRILDWSNNNGMQLINATSAIKAAGIYGYGIKHTPIYIPEAHTDFIFSVFSNNTGFIGSLLLITIILLFDYTLLSFALISNNKNIKLLSIGTFAMLFYQQIQNIGMNIGLLPITGITLPFISYGGSSLVSYILSIGLILNYTKEN